MNPSKITKVIWLFGATTLCLALSACETGGHSTSPRSTSPTVVYLVRDAKGGTKPGVPISHLMSAGVENPQPREIGKLGAVNRTFSVDPDHRLVALATDYTNNPEFLLVDIQSGAVTNATDSQGGDDSVALGPHGAVAFCDSNGTFKVGTLDQIAQSATVEQHRPAQGCPDSGWRDDSTLAFVAEVPLDNPEPGRPQALYVRARDGTLTHIDLLNIRGYSQATWSSDGTHVAFSSAYNAPASASDRIISVEITSGAIIDVGRGSSPYFAPDDPNRLVALRDDGNNNRFLDVWQNGKIVASLKTDEAGVAWCPGGNEIAVATSAAVRTWNWRTGERRTVAQANFLDGQLIETSVACF